MINTTVSNTSSALEIRNLSKRFGDNQVVDEISFSVPAGSVYGFVGANGAGKTTTMRMILGLLRADSGEISVMGEPVTFGATATNRHIGYLNDVPEFYNYLTPREYLHLCGDIVGMSRDDIESRSTELLELVGLSNVTKRIGSFSRGMKQRLGMAAALYARPSLLICDEPTSALDPFGRKEILEVLRAIRGETTVIFSTHILSDVERICDYMCVLHKGDIVMSGTIEELKSAHKSDSLRIDFSTDVECAQLLKALPAELVTRAEQITSTELVIHTEDLKVAQRMLMDTLLDLGITVQRLEILEPTLENLYLEVAQ
jgi:ABC-2 type transport system ATP-binding protein